MEEKKTTKTVKDQLAKYLANWPVFFILLAICLGTGFLYARYTIPKYIATTSFLVKNAGGGDNSKDLIEEALNGKNQVNLNNEMLLLGSSGLMERVVRRENYNISYYKTGKILNIDVYLDAPFRLLVKEVKDSMLPVALTLQHINDKGGNGYIGSAKDSRPFSFQWNTPFVTAGKTFVLAPAGIIKNNDSKYLVTWQPVSSAAANLLSSISIAPFDIKTSAIELSLKSENLKKGQAILNAVFREFNLLDIEERTRVSDNTTRFINDRLALASTELGGVEGNLESYQGSRQLINIKSQTETSLENSNTVSKAIKDLGIQQGVANLILDYFRNPSNSNKLVPSSLGLNDATLSSLIAQYNEVQQKKEQEAPSVALNSTVMQSLNAQTSNLRNSILESLNNITKNLSLQSRNYQQQNNQFNSFLSTIPHSERTMQEIKRKQGIAEGIYLYLLQRREEEAIASTNANISRYRQVDLAKGYGPTEPNMGKLLGISLLLGLGLSFGIIYLKDLINDKIDSREEVTGKLKLPVYGEIGPINKRQKLPIDVLSPGSTSEQFRAIRTHLSFVLKNKYCKTILVTSSTVKEGKSFVSLNLAAVYAAPGKKVALLELDIRKPGLGAKFGFDTETGLTNYLTGDIDDLSEIVRSVDEIPTLDIYPSGPLLSNPADWLLAENVARLFEALKYKYDYIIVDSPPVGLVSDALVLGEFSDLVLYIVRRRITLKKELNFINDISSSKKLDNVGLILNAMVTDARRGYGYGKHSYPKKLVKVAQ